MLSSHAVRSLALALNLDLDLALALALNLALPLSRHRPPILHHDAIEGPIIAPNP